MKIKVCIIFAYQINASLATLLTSIRTYYIIRQTRQIKYAKMGAVIDGLCKGLLENVNVIHRHKKALKDKLQGFKMAARAGIEPATK